MRDEPRCYDHATRAELPPLCPTCQRIAVEREIVTRTVDALLAAGYLLRTDEQDDPRPQQPTKDRAAILREMMEVDDEYLAAFAPTNSSVEPIDGVNPVGWVRFVYGNDGYDVISDYTVNLEDVLKPIHDYADTLS